MPYRLGWGVLIPPCPAPGKNYWGFALPCLEPWPKIIGLAPNKVGHGGFFLP